MRSTHTHDYMACAVLILMSKWLVQYSFVLIVIMKRTGLLCGRRCGIGADGGNGGGGDPADGAAAAAAAAADDDDERAT